MADTSLFSMAGLIRTAIALGSVGAGKLGSESDFASQTYDSVKDGPYGGLLRAMDGTYIGNLFKENWTELAGLLGGVIAAPGKWPKILVFVGGLYTMFSKDLSDTFSRATKPTANQYEMSVDEKLVRAQRIAKTIDPEEVKRGLERMALRDGAVTQGSSGLRDIAAIDPEELGPNAKPELDNE